MDNRKAKGHSADQMQSLLGEILKTSNLDESLKSKLTLCHKLAEAHDNFVESVCPPESDLQKEIVEKTHADPKCGGRAGMLSGHVVGQFLKLTAEMMKAKRILEIGLFTGYSAVTLASSAFCEEVVSLELEEYNAKFVKAQIEGTPLENKIRIVIGSAIESLEILKAEGKGFDLVFIDADKGGYINYYKYIMDNGLLNENGVFLCDNILWGNDTILERETQGGKALYEFVKFVQNDDRVEQILFPYRDGVMLIKPKVKATA